MKGNIFDYVIQNEKLKRILDVDAGIQASGSREIYGKVVEKFYETLDEQLHKIKQSYEAQDLRNYTIQVHALKSAARLAGAVQLSDHARYLEECGKLENTAVINEQTEQLIGECRELEGMLAPFFKPDDNRPVVEMETLQDALVSLNEVVEAYDFDSADMIIRMLDKYSMPSDYTVMYQKLRSLMANVARDEIIDLLRNYVK